MHRDTKLATVNATVMGSFLALVTRHRGIVLKMTYFFFQDKYLK